MVIAMFALDRRNHDRGRGDQVCGPAFQKFCGSTRRWFDRVGIDRVCTGTGVQGRRLLMTLGSVLGGHQARADYPMERRPGFVERVWARGTGRYGLEQTLV